MKKKLLGLAIFSAVLLIAGAAWATAPGQSREPAVVEPSGVTVTIPPHARQIADGVFSLGNALDPQSGQLVEGYAFVHYKDGKIKPGGGSVKPPTCYSYLAKGAKWKTVEPWVVNPTNTRGLSGDFVFGNLGYDISKWEDAADGYVNGVEGWNILGNGESTSEVLEADMVAPDNKNEVYFADISDPNVIAVTIVWSYFGGPIYARQLVEWDQVYDNVTFDWSSSGEAGKMDFENIATHELGHSVGMNDLYTSTCSQETMYGYAALGEVIKQTLNAGDIKGVNALY